MEPKRIARIKPHRPPSPWVHAHSTIPTHLPTGPSERPSSSSSVPKYMYDGAPAVDIKGAHPRASAVAAAAEGGALLCLLRFGAGFCSSSSSTSSFEEAGARFLDLRGRREA